MSTKINLDALDWTPDTTTFPGAWTCEKATFTDPQTGEQATVYRGMTDDDSFLTVRTRGEEYDVSCGDCEGVGRELFGRDEWLAFLERYENAAWKKMPEDVQKAVAWRAAARELDEEAHERDEW